ncbi:MAG: hypothetical protein SGILL_006535, partial [Bacillariaceae sp.]
YALNSIQNDQDVQLFNSTTLQTVGSSYYSERRYIYFLPHVVGAVVWWNTYFLQLVPRVRRMFGKRLHRYLGRVLMVAAILQTTTGMGMAYTSHSNIIKLVSLVLAIAASYCVHHAWTSAVQKNFPKHKIWAIRLVGYLQTNVLQRFWLLASIISHECGWYGLYPNLNGEDVTLEMRNKVVYSMFDDSFVLAILSAFLVTEWYIAGEQGQIDMGSEDTKGNTNDFSKEQIPPEKQPLIM